MNLDDRTKLDDKTKQTILTYLGRQGFKCFNLDSEDVSSTGYVPLGLCQNQLEVYLVEYTPQRNSGVIVQPKGDFTVKYSWNPRPLKQLFSNLRVLGVGSSLEINSAIAAPLLSIPREFTDVYWISLKRVAR